MASTTTESYKVENESTIASYYQFIPVKALREIKDQTTRRLARSHAVKKALENKRKSERNLAKNFRPSALQGHFPRLASKRIRTQTGAISLYSLSTGTLDPFQTLAVDSVRLQSLLNDYKARQAPEPVFSVAKELQFQSINSVFQTGFTDPALSNAAMFSMVFAVTGGIINEECLSYQVQAISHVRQRLRSMDESISDSVIGAILLLGGVEARLGTTSQAQLHIGAVQQLLQLCQKNGIRLTGGIKRAIFWQDLNSSILAGSHRIVDHTTFDELRWTRDPFPPDFFQLPPGFQKISHLFPTAYVEVLRDLNALKYVRDRPSPVEGNEISMEQINNHIASIQSRLVSLPNLSPVLDCCKLAANICSTVMCCTVWCALVIPSYLSSQLLRRLQNTKDDSIWDDYPDLLLWLLYVGGAFLPKGTLRSEYIVLLHSNTPTRFDHMCKSLQDVHEALKTFVWLDRAFMSETKALWEESFV